MSEQKTDTSRRKKFFKFILVKFPVILLVLAAILFVTLKLVERYPVPLREGFEQYLSEASQSTVSIGTLDKATFVPNLDFDLKDITFHRAGNVAKIDVKIGRIKVSAPFLSTTLSQNKFQTILVENLNAKEASFLPKELIIKKAEIIDRDGPEQFGSFLVTAGTYNKSPLVVEASLLKKGDVYQLQKETPFFIAVGDTKIEGNIIRGLTDVRLENTVFTVGEDISAANDYVLVKKGDYIKNNPLSCVIMNGNGAECAEYLIGERKEEK